jgi:GMP synthase-like glutamine amidotransferase
MGAPWSVYGEHVAPWIEDALGGIRDAVEHHVPVLGICFGAQAFAQAMGGRARPAEDHEVGWRLVQTSDTSLVPEGPWFMWHGDTFDLPADATTVAWTDVGVQAYTMGPHLCVQFHPEATAGWWQRGWSDGRDIRRAGLDRGGAGGDAPEPGRAQPRWWIGSSRELDLDRIGRQAASDLHLLPEGLAQPIR